MTNKKDYILRFSLASDAIFGSAERSSPIVDIDIQHDRWGCPYLPGRTLKGVLREECANILFALRSMHAAAAWEVPAERLFGVRGGGKEDVILRFRNAELPQKEVICTAVDDRQVTPKEVLDALTDIRSQTSIDYMTGSARPKSLRSMRVIIRGALFEAPLHFVRVPEDNELRLLCACVKALRRLGSSRNRGLGELQDVVLLDSSRDDTAFKRAFDEFKGIVSGGKGVAR